MYFPHISGVKKRSDNIDLGLTDLNTSTIDQMPYDNTFMDHKMTFLKVKNKVSLNASVKNSREVGR